MPQLDNPGLDDPLLLDGSMSFAGGQFSSTRGSSVPDGAFHSAINMDYDAVGGLVTRRGVDQLVGSVVNAVWENIDDQWQLIPLVWSDEFTSPIRDIFYFDSTAGEYIAVADGSNTIKFASDTAAITVITSSSYSTDNVYFAQMTNRLYYCDGAAALRYITAGQTNTAITAGRITSVTIQEAGLGYITAPTVTISGAGAGAAMTAVLGPGGVVAAILITNAGTGYTQSTRVSLQAAPPTGVDATAIPGISQLPTSPKLLIHHTGRLFCVSSDPAFTDTFYVSDILDGESWDLYTNSVAVGGGDGDPITALFAWHGFKLLVFKERSIWVVEANPSLPVPEWEVSLVSSRVGCTSHKSLQQVGSDVFFLSRDGVQSLSTIQSGAQTGLSVAISAPVQDLLDTIDPSLYGRVSAVYYRNRYILSFPSTITDFKTVIFSTLTKAWAGPWEGWEPRAYTVTSFGGNIRMVFGDDNGKLFTFLDYNIDGGVNESHFLDQGVPYESYVVTRAYNFGEPYADKFGYQAQFSVDNTFLNNQAFSISFLPNLIPMSSCLTEEDGDSLLTELGDCLSLRDISILSNDIIIPPDTGLFRKSINLQSFGRFSEVQFLVSAESGRLSLHSVKSSAFADTIRPEI